jgi:GTP-binding protein HflX
MEEKSAILVGININENEHTFEKSMEELKDLCVSSGLEEFYEITQNRDKYDAKFLIGKGKLEEIKDFVDNHEIDLVVFNDELSGSQMSNIMEALDIKVVDRPALILDIFAKRAKTRLAKLQIELAQLKYRLPRLKGFGESMSKLGAGIGTRGPGEQKLEIDRRRINERITDIKKKLEHMESVRRIQRKKRVESSIPIVSMVGYSNVGKSTLLNNLVKTPVEEKQVYVDDMLFATLGTNSRLIELDSKKNFILNDTVGFVSKLPHFLIEAFKATLEEITTSDLILHVVDIQSDNLENQIKVTNDILTELNCGEIPKLLVYNKADLVDEINENSANEIKISALNRLNLDMLLNKIDEIIYSDMINMTLLFPFDKSDLASYIFDKYEINEKKYTANGLLVNVDLDEEDVNRFEKFRVDDQIE